MLGQIACKAAWPERPTWADLPGIQPQHIIAVVSKPVNQAGKQPEEECATRIFGADICVPWLVRRYALSLLIPSADGEVCVVSLDARSEAVMASSQAYW